MNEIKDEMTFTKTYNIRGGLLILTFCAEGMLESAETIGGRDYGKTNAELGRISEDTAGDDGEQTLSLNSSGSFTVSPSSAGTL